MANPLPALQRTALLLALASVLFFANPAQAQVAVEDNALPALFDPDRHIRTRDVRVGMTGYGKTVFKGTEIESFPVTVIAVLENTQQLGTDIVLIDASSEKLDLYGPIQGMSGSPIYLRCEDGKDRMLGAFAFGWEFSKKTLVGIQPIEQMLRLDSTPDEPAPRKAAAGTRYDLLAKGAIGPLRSDWKTLTAGGISALADQLAGRMPPSRGNAFAPPLAMPLAVANATPKVRQLLDRVIALRAGSGVAGVAGVVPMTGMGAGQGAEVDVVEPGSSLVVPLLRGDLEMNVVGTCTEVIDRHVFAYGHPLFNSGELLVPMAAGRVEAIIPLLTSSFKIGTTGKIVGTLSADATTGVAGSFGEPPPFTPIDVAIRFPTDEGESTRRFHFEAARDPSMSSTLILTAVMQAIEMANTTDSNGSMRWDITVTFDSSTGPREAKFVDIVTNRAGGSTTMALSMLFGIQGIMENPFDRLALTKIDAKIDLLDADEFDAIALVGASLLHSTYKPGDTVRIELELESFFGGRELRTVEMTLPDDLPEGDYPLSVLSAPSALQVEASNRPDLMMPDSIDDLFAALAVPPEFPNDALFLRLDRPDEIAISVGGATLAKLPPSLLTLLATTERSDVLPVMPAITKRIDLDAILDTGEVYLQITVEKP